MSAEETSLGLTRPSSKSRHRSDPVLAPACTPSRYRFPCGVCSADIVPGDHMFPFVANPPPSTSTPTWIRSGEGSSSSLTDDFSPNEDKKPRQTLMWAHRSCAAAGFGPKGVPPPPTCRHWSRLGRCPVRDAGCCAFGHEETDRGGDATAASSASGGENEKRRWRGKRRVIRNGHKNSALRIFLIRTYGVDYLRGGVVLEVAGGKGELSWELLNLVGVECVNVDPRPMSLNNAEARWRKGMYEPRRTGPVFRKWLPAVEEGSSQNRSSRRPRHLRCFFHAEPFVRLAQCRADDTDSFDAQRWLKGERSKADSISWTTRGLQHEDEDTSGEHGCDNPPIPESESSCIQEYDEEDQACEVTDADDARDLLSRTALVLGLHPDQAAGDIVRFADCLGVPWCIVPCCVYSDLFAKRRLKDGTRVSTHEHLVRWLEERNPEARVETLGMDGKNQIVYTLPR